MNIRGIIVILQYTLSINKHQRIVRVDERKRSLGIRSFVEMFKYTIIISNYTLRNFVS